MSDRPALGLAVGLASWVVRVDLGPSTASLGTSRAQGFLIPPPEYSFGCDVRTMFLQIKDSNSSSKDD